MEPTLVGAEAPATTTRAGLLTPLAGALLLVGAIVFLWEAPSSYEIFKALHVAFAVVWVGGGVALTIIALAAVRQSDPQELRVVAKYAELLGMRVFTPAGLVVLAFGIAMVEKAGWGWSTFWLDFALAVWALSYVVGAAVLGPQSKRIHELFEASRGEMTPEIEAAIKRIIAIARFDVVMLLLIVVDMAAKPTF